MLQKLKQLYWKYFPKKLADPKDPKKVTSSCQQCRYRFLSVKQKTSGEWQSKAICALDDMQHSPYYTCKAFKNIIQGFGPKFLFNIAFLGLHQINRQYSGCLIRNTKIIG